MREDRRPPKRSVLPSLANKPIHEKLPSLIGTGHVESFKVMHDSHFQQDGDLVPVSFIALQIKPRGEHFDFVSRLFPNAYHRSKEDGEIRTRVTPFELRMVKWLEITHAPMPKTDREKWREIDKHNRRLMWLGLKSKFTTNRDKRDLIFEETHFIQQRLDRLSGMR